MKFHVTSSLRARTSILFARRNPYWWRSKCLPMARISLRTIGIAGALAFAVTFAFGQTVASNAEGWVVLPVSEYAALRHAAFPAEVEAAPPAVEATLSRLDYDLKVDGDLASGEARLTVDVIREGWVRVPLPDGLMVRDAKLAGREVSLVKHASDKGPGTDRKSTRLNSSHDQISYAVFC